MTDWPKAIPLITLLAVVFAAGGVLAIVKRLERDVRDLLKAFEAMGLIVRKTEQDLAVVGTRLDDHINTRHPASAR